VVENELPERTQRKNNKRDGKPGREIESPSAIRKPF
jgi:hypothetical protein